MVDNAEYRASDLLGPTSPAVAHAETTLADPANRAAAMACEKNAISSAQEAVDSKFGSCQIVKGVDLGSAVRSIYRGPDGQVDQITDQSPTGDKMIMRLTRVDSNSWDGFVPGTADKAKINNVTLSPDGKTLAYDAAGVRSGHLSISPDAGSFTINPTQAEKGLGFMPTTMKFDGTLLVSGKEGQRLAIHPDGQAALQFKDRSIRFTTITPDKMSRFKAVDGGPALLGVTEIRDHQFLVKSSVPGPDVIIP
jgi:hypothetical protein